MGKIRWMGRTWKIKLVRNSGKPRQPPKVAASKLAFQFVRAGIPETAVATTTQPRSTTRAESSVGEHLTFSMQSLCTIRRVTFT